MSNTAYYLAWLAAGLAGTAIASAWITRHLRWRVARKLMAVRSLDALARYCHWVQSQRHASFFEGDCHEADSPLEELLVLERDGFPELSVQMVALLAVHARLVNHLWSQQALRLHDPEAWLESDAPARFDELWREHLAAADALGRRLEVADTLPARSRGAAGAAVIA